MLHPHTVAGPAERRSGHFRRPRLAHLIAVLLLLVTAACDLFGTTTPEPTSITIPPTPVPNTPLPGTQSTVSPPTATAEPPPPTLPPQPTATVPPTPTTPPSVPKGGTLTVRIGRDVTTLNPFFVQKSATDVDRPAALVTGLVFAGLTRIDDQLRPQPDLAESWAVAPDGLSIDFKLRQGVRWHDGQPLTVDDVIWTYNAWLDLPFPTPLQFQLRDAVLQIQPADPAGGVVRFFLKKPFAPVLTYVSAPILPRHLLVDVPLDQMASSSFSFNPVGSGPYKFAEHKEGENVVLVANPDYYGGAPNISRVAFLVAPDEQVANTALGDGSLMLAELGYDSWQGWSNKAEGQGQLSLGSYPDLGYYFVAFNLRENHAFQDRRLRQAWAYALNKEELVRGATGGQGLPIWNDISPVSWAYSAGTPRLDNDPDKARQLLDDAGWVDSNDDGIRDRFGEPLQVTIFVRADDDRRRAAADAMVASLKAVGIGLTVSPVDFDSVLRAKLDPTLQNPFDWHVLMMGWDSASYDPDNFALFHSSQIPTLDYPQGLNYVAFASQEYDELSFKARNEYDYGLRQQMYFRMQQIVGEELPYYFLWADRHFLALNSHVKGPINLNSPRLLWNVERWWIE